MNRMLLAIAIAIGTAGFTPLWAQQGRPVAEGDEVRVRLNDGTRLAGRVTGRSDSSVALVTAPGRAPMDLDYSRITRIDVATGKRDRGRGAARGALIGGAFGAGLGFGAGESDCSGKIVCFSRGEAAAILGLGGAGFGLVLGLVAAPREYERATVGPMTVNVAPMPDGTLGLTFSAPF